MSKTFNTDDRMIITIPLSSPDTGRGGQLLPENFYCVFKNVYMVFLQGNPKALGTAQFIAGLLIISLGLLLAQSFHDLVFTVTAPSVLFLVSGSLSYAAGHSPNLCVTKLSFSLNIISFFWALAALIIYFFIMASHSDPGTTKGIQGMMLVLFVLELVVAMALIYWESKAVCREHFNILPIVNLEC